MEAEGLGNRQVCVAVPSDTARTEKAEEMGAFLWGDAAGAIPQLLTALTDPAQGISLVYPVTGVSYWPLPRARRQEIFL